MSHNTVARSALFSFLLLLGLGSGASPLQAQIQVTSATPNMAAEGTINLNVIVGGNGFKKGAKAAWFQSGTTNPGDVTVNSTSVNSSSQVTANITVSTAGFTGSYDIVVTNADGRSGKGTQLFSVTNGQTKSCLSANQSINVTSIFADTDTSDNPFQLQSDGLGAYFTYTNSKTDSVTSQIQATSCDLLFDITNSASRAVRVTLLYPASTPSAPPPFTNPTPVRSRIITTCFDNALNGKTSLGLMTFAGQTLDCAFRIGEIPYNGNTYAVVFDPSTFAGSTWAHVTCTGAQSSQCNAWTITGPPTTVDSSTGQVSAIGELLQVSTVKGKTVSTQMGLYFVSLSITIHE
ncbi:MAG TPA: hypothetical protein VG028_21930 [Terriglobia bacterium]|nr:hypothetical protein [Terriglobia bacterium]